jgi:hypothetical protein
MTEQLPAPVREHYAMTAVCDPQLPVSFRWWVLRQRACFDSRGNLLALTPGGSSRGVRPAVIGGWGLAAACVALLFVGPMAVSWVAWLTAALAAAISAATIQFRTNRKDMRLARSKVIFPDNLDAQCQALLGRAQSAIDTVLSSRVRADGLLGNPVDDAMLRENEWQIAGRLRTITSLRSLRRADAAGGPVGPLANDVLERQRRALELAQEGTISRVIALECYAAQIAAADEAERDYQQATRLARHNDKYLDLVAHTASDNRATEEITGMTEWLAIATRTRRERLHDADLAARALVLPSESAPDPDEGEGG